ncbi:MAG: GNAT family N-acetyltransferase [Candidatus Binataceae bacterium]
MTLIIRFATPSDAETILSFIRGLAEYEHEPDAVKATAAGLRAWLESSDPPFECLLAEDTGEAVGFALFFRNYSTWSNRPGLYLEDLFVPERLRGHGIGRALMNRLAQIALERGWSRIQWSVLDWNTPSQSFYRSLGARPANEWTMWDIEGDALAGLAKK